MNIKKYAEHIDLDDAMKSGEPFLALVSFDGERAFMAHIDESMEHHILLAKLGLPSGDIDKYFRIVFDDEGADWTFVCPPGYKHIADRTRRISEFYKDGFAVIPRFLSEVGYPADVKIPKRYRRHVEAMGLE